MSTLAHRVARLDHGISPQACAIARLSDAELGEMTKIELGNVHPALADRYAAVSTMSELNALFDEFAEARAG
jgi:hypothetical protein